MNISNQEHERHFHDPVRGVVIGDNNIVDIEHSTAPFLAPSKPPYLLIGRDTALKELKAKLFAGDAIALSALNGLPGIGKTALAVELAHDKDVRKHFVDGVLWAGLGRNADPFRHLGIWMVALGFPDNAIANTNTPEERKQHLQRVIGTRRMLLVVDDAWTTKDAGWFKVGGLNSAHLLTTRQPEIALDFAGKEGRATIYELSLEDSLLLLKEFASDVVEQEPEEAKDLVIAIGRLPIALVLMGKYLRKAHYKEPGSIHQALERLKSHEERVKTEQIPPALQFHPGIEGASISLYTIIAMTDEALDENTRTVFRRLAVFSPKPDTLSEEAALYVTTKPADYLDTLYDYGVLEGSKDDRHMIHQTISDYAALKLGENPEEEHNTLNRHSTYFAEFLEQREIQLEHKIPKEPLNEIEVEIPNIRLMWKRSLEQHQDEIVQKASDGFQIYCLLRGQHHEGEEAFGQAVAAFEEHGNAQYSLASLLLAARMALFQGRFLQSLGQYDEVEKIYKRSLQMQVIGLMSVCQDMTLSFNNLSTLYQLQGRSHEIEEYYGQILPIYQTVIGSSHNILSFNGLTRLYHNRGRYKQTELLIQQALEMGHGQDDSSLAISSDKLAALYGNQEREAHVQESSQQAIDIFEQILGEKAPAERQSHVGEILQKLSDGLQIFDLLWGEHREGETALLQSIITVEKQRDMQYPLASVLLAARMMLSLGHSLQSRGQYENMEALYKRALQMQTAGLRAVYQDITTSLKNLATFYETQGRYPESVEYYSQILQIRKQVLGQRHQDFATSLIDLARLYHTIEQYPKAEQLFLESLNILQAKTGPDLATLYNNLAALYKSQGRYEEAEPYYLKSFDIWESVLGSENPYLATLKNNLGGLYQAEGKYAEAETLYQEALEMRKKLFGQEHLDVAQSLHNIAGLRLSQGRDREAETLYQESLRIRKQFLKPEHPDLALSLNNLADVYRIQGKYAEAEPFYKRSLNILKNVFGLEHLHVATVLDNLALIYHFQGRYFEAIPLYRHSLETRRKILGPEHPEVAQSLNNLARLYYSLGRYPEAEKRFLQSLSIQEKSVEVNHPDTAFLLSNIAEVYRAQGKHAQANQFDQRALAIAESLKNFAEQYELQQEYADAETLYYQSLKIKELMLGAGHSEVAELRTRINDLREKVDIHGE